MEEKTDYLSILNNLHESPVRDRNSSILILDGLNTFLRAFSVVKTVNPNGYNVGGITGFLKSLGSLKRQFNPSRIIVVWDGKGGSTNRKHLNANYKAQRAHAAVIHWDLYDSKEEEMQSVHDQADRLEDYLRCLPITYIKVDKLEADDVIAYLAHSADKVGNKVIVVSTDRDFLQLVSKNIQVYNPVKKVIYDQEETFKFLGILPENYNLVKALVGDSSDNLEGVRGAGLKTIAKLFPELTKDSSCTLQYIYDKCSENLKKSKLYAKILTEWNKVEQNFRIMDLQESVLSEKEKEFVITEVRRPVGKVQIGRFLALLEQDYISEITSNTESWLLDFSNLS